MLARGLAIWAVILGIGLLVGCEQTTSVSVGPGAAPTSISGAPKLPAEVTPTASAVPPQPSPSAVVTAPALITQTALPPVLVRQSAQPPTTAQTPTPTTAAPNRAEPSAPDLAIAGQRLIAFQSFRDGAEGLYVMREDGLDEVRWRDGADPVWSPDGKRLAFSQVRNNRDTLQVLDVSSTAAETISLTTGFSPAWSPDGRWLAFADTRQGNADIYLITADGSNEHVLHRSPVNEIDPCWSPDGTRIAFERSGQIVISGLDGTDQAVLSSGKTYASHPAWSPDGTRIAFSWRSKDTNSDDTIDPQDDSQIALVNTDGTGLALLTAFASTLGQPVWAQHPAWSPDGSQLAFESNRDGKWDIFVMKADGTELRNLTGAVKDSVNVSPSWRVAIR